MYQYYTVVNNNCKHVIMSDLSHSHLENEGAFYQFTVRTLNVAIITVRE